MIKTLLTAVVIHVQLPHTTKSGRQNLMELSHWAWDQCTSGTAGHAKVMNQIEKEKLFLQENVLLS